MNKSIDVNDKVLEVVSSCEKELQDEFKKWDELCFRNSSRIR